MPILSLLPRTQEGEEVSEHRVLVCGGRDFTDMRWLTRVLDELEPKPTIIIQGGARGADYLAWKWATERIVPCQEYRAEWEKYGRAAGPRRNLRMLAEGRPQLIVAFPGGPGTADMVRRAKAAGVPVLEVK